MVPLTVTVTDATGKHVTGLTGGDFTVFEDGVEQPLSFFASEDVPVDVALVLDTSSSMQADLPLVQTAASGLVRTLRASDRGAVVEVKDSVRIPQPFTTDRAQIEAILRALSDVGRHGALRRALRRAQGVRARAGRERPGQAAGARAAVGRPGHHQPSRVR